MAAGMAVAMTDGGAVETGRVLDLDGRRVHLLEAGAGPPVLLLHGLGGLAQEVAAPLSGLLARHHRVLAPDRPGYGFSDPLPAAEMAPHRQAVWLAGLLRRLGAARPVVVAHSIAAATALCLALHRPDSIAGLVLVNPYCRPTRPAAMPLLRLAVAPVVGPPLRRWLLPRLAGRLAGPRLAALFAPDPVPPGFAGFPVRHAVSGAAMEAMAAELRGFNGSMLPAALRLRRLGVPTVVLAGGADTVADPVRHAHWLVRRLPAARLRRLPGYGHMLHHLHPQVVADAVAEVGDRARRPCAPALSGYFLSGWAAR